MKGRNVIQDDFIDNENYSCVSFETLELVLPQKSVKDVERERPGVPLMERTEKEKAILRTLPFFFID